MSQYPEARFVLSANATGQFLPDTGSEVAVAGRSNAGKSSAINVIVNRRQFARTSKTPGRTQLVNFFELADGQRLVDLPGYGFAKVPLSVKKAWGPMMRSGQDKSLFARQVERYADIYTSRVSNFAYQTPFAYWRAPRGSLPHDMG